MKLAASGRIATASLTAMFGLPLLLAALPALAAPAAVLAPATLAQLEIPAPLVVEAGEEDGERPHLAPAEQGLAATVRQRLADDTHLSPQAVDALTIDARNGVVRLRGTVPCTIDRLLVGTLTRSVDGVRVVVNEVLVPSEDPPRCDESADATPEQASAHDRPLSTLPEHPGHFPQGA